GWSYVLAGLPVRVVLEAGEQRGEYRVPACDAPHGVGELRGADRLRHVPAGTRPDDADDVLARVRHREREEAGGHVPAAGDDVDPAPAATAGEVDVEED